MIDGEDNEVKLACRVMNNGRIDTDNQSTEMSHRVNAVQTLCGGSMLSRKELSSAANTPDDRTFGMPTELLIIDKPFFRRPF